MYYYFYPLPGLILTLNETNILSGSNISMSAIGTSKDNATLFCRSEVNYGSNKGNWYLHPTQIRTEEMDRIVSGYRADRGWHRTRVNYTNYRIVSLWRNPANTAEEGIFACTFTVDISAPVSVGIHYPSKSPYYCLRCGCKL